MACGIVYTQVYIQTAANSHFINRWDGESNRALYEEPATLIFYGQALPNRLTIGTLLRDLDALKLWEIVAVEEVQNNGTNPPQWNTRVYVRHTKPPSAPGSYPPPSFSTP
jgi:hypothetical protein